MKLKLENGKNNSNLLEYFNWMQVIWTGSSRNSIAAVDFYPTRHGLEFPIAVEHTHTV
jgi:hypothetical protein